MVTTASRGEVFVIIYTGRVFVPLSLSLSPRHRYLALIPPLFPLHRHQPHNIMARGPLGYLDRQTAAI